MNKTKSVFAKSLSLLIAVLLIIATIPMTVVAAGNTLPEAVGGVVTLTEDMNGAFDLASVTKLDLAGYKFEGSVTNATGVTVVNNITTQKQKTEEGTGLPLYHQETAEGLEGTTVSQWPVMEEVTEDTPAGLLAATGIYKNDVSNYVADGYDVKGTSKNEVFNNEANSNFNIVLKVKADKGDRDPSSTNIEDVFADDTVTVEVSVEGARYVSADMTITWDKTLFDDVTKGRDVKAGWVKQSNGDYRFTKAHDNDGYWQSGEVIGKFQFKAKYIDEDIVTSKSFETKDAVISASERGSYNVFTVKNTAEGASTETAKVIGSWRKAKLDATTDPLTTAQLKDDVAHIVLMDSMTGSVEAKSGLIYKAMPLDLLNKTYNTNGYSALVGGQPVANSKVATVVYTKDQYYGVQKKDGDGNLLYHQESATGSEGTAVTEWPVYEEGKSPVTVAYGTAGTSINALADANYQAENAGDYVVCYKVSAPGYVSSTGIREVHIDKQPVTLTWIAPAYDGTTNPTGKTFGKEDKLGSDAIADFYGQFDAVGFKNPTATYVDLNSQTVTIGDDADEVELTTGPNGTTQKDVGAYTFTALDNKNYEFTNPTCTVQVVGMKIEGYQLTATGSTTDPKTGVMYRDGIERAIGSLVVADTASFKLNTEDSKYYTTDGNNTEVTNVAIKYEYSTDGGDTWTVTTDPTASPKYSALGEYKLRVTVTADNYEKLEQEVTFTIKDPIFKVETSEYVAGYTLVLVYTNEDVQFRYGDTMMYDESMFGYKYLNTTSYTYVYGLVVKGVADESLVFASNNAAQVLHLPGYYVDDDPTKGKLETILYNNTSTDKYVNDVNNTKAANAKVDLDDMTAVQSIYNVNAGNMLDMEVVLRADVNRDKKVDTIGDVAQVMAYYLAH